MKKAISIACLLLLALGLTGCIAASPAEQEYWGSFTNAPVVSDDGKYRAEHSAVRRAEHKVSVIEVRVYDHQTGALVDRFIPARAMDFWGICWEEGSHRIWIQSADIGIHCYELQGEKWVLNEGVVRPASIVSKWDD